MRRRRGCRSLGISASAARGRRTDRIEHFFFRAPIDARRRVQGSRPLAMWEVPADVLDDGPLRESTRAAFGDFWWMRTEETRRISIFLQPGLTFGFGLHQQYL